MQNTEVAELDIDANALVVDDFYAIAAPPRKGYHAPVKLVRPEEFALLPQLDDAQHLILLVNYECTPEVLSQLKLEIEPSTLRRKSVHMPAMGAAVTLAKRLIKSGQHSTSHAASENISSDSLQRGATLLKARDVSQEAEDQDSSSGGGGVLGRMLSSVSTAADTAEDDEDVDLRTSPDLEAAKAASEVAHVAGYIQQHARERAVSRRNIGDAARVWLHQFENMLSGLSARNAATGIIIALHTPQAELRRLGLETGQHLLSPWFAVNAFLSDDILQQLPLPTLLTVLSSEAWEQTAQKAMQKVECIITPIPLLAGDHLFRQMRESGTLKLLEHHGIYTGDGRIIHFSGNEFALRRLLSRRSSGRTKIKETNILRFMAMGSRLRVKRYNHCLPIRDTLELAQGALLDTDAFGPYDLLKNNCEHFARWCKTGTARSKQVEKAALYGTAAAAAGSLLVAALVASRKRR